MYLFRIRVGKCASKNPGQTLQESRVECLKAIKTQLVDIQEALLKVEEKDNDPAIASEANSIAEKELGEFAFLVSIIIWYQILNEVNIMSKRIEDKDLNAFCDELENKLKYEGKSDINGHELYMELKSFDIIGACEFKNHRDILMHLNEAQIFFPNTRIAYRILLTVPVTVAYAKKTFSKMKLLNNYLRSTMSQQILSGLAMMTIENEILESINCEEVTKQFATKNARRASKANG
ncbi:uncharacterized protein [Rutidosis leptorrhynchoides]|uniref:uncharacterized protein n=1 Tax=Rutidosis leptorrhynchoides TaxID=125765 RepID=UPI003A98DF70